MSDQPDWTGTSASYAQQRSYSAVQTVSTTLAAGNAEQVTFLAPSGTFVTLAAVQFSCNGPATSTTGTHSMEAMVGTGFTQDVFLINGAADTTSELEYEFGYWVLASNGQYPPSSGNQSWYSGRVGVDDSGGLIMQYTNSTNAAQTAQRNYAMVGIQTVYRA